MSVATITSPDGVFQQNTHLYEERTLNRGTSFKMRGDWDNSTIYFNDDFIIEFVIYDNNLYYCLKSNRGNIPEVDSIYWKLVLTSTTSLSDLSVEFNEGDTYLQWRTVGSTEWIDLILLSSIIGPQGNQGSQGTTGSGINIVGSLNDISELPETGNKNDTYLINGYLYVWIETEFINIGYVQGPQGAQGLTGAQGVRGYQGYQGIQGTFGNQGVVGPQGYTGAQGVQGYIGSQGIIGAQGAQGTQGFIGHQGAQGYTGNQGVGGVQGTLGAQGSQGYQGSGVQGSQGTFGSQGAQGNQGVQGYQGTGVQGVQGVQGILGTQGAVGIQGANGTSINIIGTLNNISELPGSATNGDSYLIDGNLYVYITDSFQNMGQIKGPQGNQGVQGAQGAQGNIGIQGAIGAQGFQGVQGIIGVTGAQGAQGTQGVTGVQGSIGSQGSTGATGAQGFYGPQGVIGVQGALGIQGSTGATGVQGAIGSQGTQGFRGYQGFQGAQGYTGNQGFTGETGVIISSTPNTDPTIQIRIDPEGSSISGVGPQGVQGTNGTIGVNGVQGAQGIQGPVPSYTIDDIVTGLKTKVLSSTPVALTVSSNAIAWDASQGQLYTLTLTADAVLNNPTNIVVNAIYQIEVNQDNSGLRVLTWGTYYKFPNNAVPVISLDANAVDIITIYVKSATQLLVTYVQNFS